MKRRKKKLLLPRGSFAERSSSRRIPAAEASQDSLDKLISEDEEGIEK
jgi:hypothetical protein